MNNSSPIPFFGHFAFANLSLKLHGQGRHIVNVANSYGSPFRSGNLAMGRMNFSVDGIRISSERHAKKVAAKRIQHWRRHLGLWFVLPGTDVVRLDRTL